jgi:hypothetical protein
MDKSYSRVIVGTAVLIGLVYAFSCVFFEFRIIYRKYIPAPAMVHPVLLFIVGATFGLAITCLFAPARFLHGEWGRKYFEVLGVNNLMLFRMKCLLLCILFGTVTGVVCWMVLPDLLENYGLLSP